MPARRKRTDLEGEPSYHEPEAEPEVVYSLPRGVKSASPDEEKVIAAFAHLSILLIPIIGPLIIWFLYREKNQFVRKQALQALGFQVVIVGFNFLISLAMVFLWVILIGVLMAPFFMLFSFASVIYSLYAAYQVLIGKNFKYMVIGNWIEQKTS